MSTLADHYHKEKEKNVKLMSELTRQNQTLEMLDTHFSRLKKEKDICDLQLDDMKD
jgi:hypothetical protein